MTAAREFASNFIKVRRTGFLWLHILLPAAMTFLFLLYEAEAGYRIIPDARAFFLLAELGAPSLAGIAAAVLVQTEQNAGELGNLLGVAGSRIGVFLGKFGFFMFFSAISVVIYEGCFCVGSWYFLGRLEMDGGSLLAVFGSCVGVRGALCLLSMIAAFRLGAGASILLGVGGSVLAALLENPIGDRIWPLVPWEWGVRFLKRSLGFSGEPVLAGAVGALFMTVLLLAAAVWWFDKWEGRREQE